jgi:tripartite-type tricarboxylate transporter receptor subunit TctC
MLKMKAILRVTTALAIGSALAVSALPSLAQSWPQRTVKFILPLGPGSGADISARLIADRLATRWGQSVVIENRPGGDGFVAINAFVSSRDDHTLLYGPAGAFTAHPYLHAKLPYNQRDITPIARVSSTVVTVAVPASLPVSSVAELMALAREQPGKLNWASITGASDLIFEAFRKTSNIEMVRVPYRDPVQALNDLAEGRIQMYMAALAIVRSHAQAGRIKILAVTNRERAPVVPDAPTVREAGFAALTFDGLVGLYGPPDFPGEVRARIAADIKAVLTDPTVAARLTATGQLVIPGTAAEFAIAIDEQRTQMAAVAQVLGIKAAQ